MIRSLQLCVTIASAAKMQGEFLKGFETGILVRSDERAFKDFSCPPAETASDAINKLVDMMGPVKMAATLSGNPQLQTVTHQLETFVNAMRDMTGVFKNSYDGGDFCKGLIFGRDGANMLYEIAMSMVESDEVKVYETEKKKAGSRKEIEKTKSVETNKTKSNKK